ncbi:MAG: hypothetical protein ACLQU2_11835 [Candidatus Binataceae bacterium]
MASEIAPLIGGIARAASDNHSWIFIDLSEEHELSFYRDGDQIMIRGRDAGKCYELNVSPSLSTNGHCKEYPKSKITILKLAEWPPASRL